MRWKECSFYLHTLLHLRLFKKVIIFTEKKKTRKKKGNNVYKHPCWGRKCLLSWKLHSVKYKYIIIRIYHFNNLIISNFFLVFKVLFPYVFHLCLLHAFGIFFYSNCLKSLETSCLSHCIVLYFYFFLFSFFFVLLSLYWK